MHNFRMLLVSFALAGCGVLTDTNGDPEGRGDEADGGEDVSNGDPEREGNVETADNNPAEQDGGNESTSSDAGETRCEDSPLIGQDCVVSFSMGNIQNSYIVRGSLACTNEGIACEWAGCAFPVGSSCAHHNCTENNPVYSAECEANPTGDYTNCLHLPETPCQAGTHLGRWQCDNTVAQPYNEACVPVCVDHEIADNGLDDDCNGEVDEDDSCIPSEEICDYQDNNCDGQIDNGFHETGTGCYVGDGVCRMFGTWSCEGCRDSETSELLPLNGSCVMVTYSPETPVPPGTLTFKGDVRAYVRDCEGDTSELNGMQMIWSTHPATGGPPILCLDCTPHDDGYPFGVGEQFRDPETDVIRVKPRLVNLEPDGEVGSCWADLNHYLPTSTNVTIVTDEDGELTIEMR